MMLSKKTFVDAMNAIIKHSEIMEELRGPLRKLSDFPLSLDFESIHREALLKVLREVTGDDSDWITWWLYEDGDKIVEWEEDETEVSANLTSVEALYDFLLARPITICCKRSGGRITVICANRSSIPLMCFGLCG